MSLKTFKRLLEDRHFNRVSNETVFQLADTSAEFCSFWLVHALRSDASDSELLLCFAYAEKWHLPALAGLTYYLEGVNGFPKKDQQVTTELIQSLVLSHKNLNFKQAELLFTALYELSSRDYQQANYSEEVDLYKAALKDELLEKIISDSKPFLREVTLYGKQNSQGIDKSIRNNFHYPSAIPNVSLESALLERHICKIANIPIKYAEPPVILRYQPGQYYQWHYDFIYPHNQQALQQVEQFGQRDKTCIYYLNEDCEGGETEFKKLNISIKPKLGSLVSFNNCDESGQRNNLSLHRGTDVIQGEKWIMTLWFRSKPYWLRTGLIQ